MEAYQIILYDEADVEFTKAAQWYKGGNEKIGIDFIQSVKRKLNSIQNHPERYSKIKGKYRQTSLAKFPYCIVYFIEKREMKIYVTSIFHHKRNPATKFRK